MNAFGVIIGLSICDEKGMLALCWFYFYFFETLSPVLKYSMLVAFIGN